MGGECDFVERGRPALSAAGDHGDPRRAARGRAAHAEADPGAVRRHRPDLRRKARAARRPRPGRRTIQATMADFFNYFKALTEDRRARPRDDVASDDRQRTRSTASRSPPSTPMSYYLIIATAGHDTTSSSTAGAMWALAERPAELAKVQGRPGSDPRPGRRVDPLDDAGAALHAQRRRRTPPCAARPSPRASG